MAYRHGLLFAVLLGAGVLVAVELGLTQPPRQKPRGLALEMAVEASVQEVPAAAKRVELWFPYPQEDEDQQVDKMRIEAPFPVQSYREEGFGNALFYLRTEDPPDMFRVRLFFTVQRREVRGLEGKKAPGAPPDARHLAPTRLVIINDQIQRMAARITAGKKTDLEKVRALYDFVAGYMRYDKTGKGWGNGDTRFCLTEQRGNCTDYHSLFMSLTRAIGIPSSFEIGFPVPAKPQGEIAGYHCWARVFLKDYGWVPVDISEGDKHPEQLDYYFGNLDERRVLFTRGRDLRLSPPQQAGPVNYLIYPYVEVDGRQHDGVETRVSYRELAPVSQADTVPGGVRRAPEVTGPSRSP